MEINNSWNGIENVGKVKVKCTKCDNEIVHEYKSVFSLKKIWKNIEKEINEQMK